MLVGCIRVELLPVWGIIETGGLLIGCVDRVCQGLLKGVLIGCVRDY